MKRFAFISIPSFVIGAVFGALFWYLASPLWIDQVVSETLASGDQVEIRAMGLFSDADAAHKGQGIAKLVHLPNGAHEIQLSDFSVTNGPDLELWLSSHPDPKIASDVSSSPWISLGRLKGNIGNQSYHVPEGADLNAYRSVVVWCEQFGVLFSPAPLVVAGQ